MVKVGVIRVTRCKSWPHIFLKTLVISLGVLHRLMTTSNLNFFQNTMLTRHSCSSHVGQTFLSQTSQRFKLGTCPLLALRP